MMQNNNQIDVSKLFMQQAASMNQSQVKLSYCDILSLILVVLKGLGYLSCSWVVPFIPLCVPIVAYIIVAIITVIKIKFFTK